MAVLEHENTFGLETSGKTLCSCSQSLLNSFRSIMHGCFSLLYFNCTIQKEQSAYCVTLKSVREFTFRHVIYRVTFSSINKMILKVIWIKLPHSHYLVSVHRLHMLYDKPADCNTVVRHWVWMDVCLCRVCGELWICIELEAEERCSRTRVQALGF